MVNPFKWERNADYAWEKVENGVVVFDLPGQKVYELNEGAAWMWTALDVPRSREGLTLTVALEYGLEYDDVCSEVDKFISTASVHGLLHKKINPISRFLKKLRKTVRILRS